MGSGENKVLKRADPTTIHEKFLVQYSAEYTCPGDGRPIPGNVAGWNRWFKNDNGVLEPRFDLFPDVSDYSPPELFDAPALPLHYNETAKLFSSRHPKTIQRHFHWMAKHAIDGAFLTRKASALETNGIYDSPKAEWTKWRDDVGQLVEYAAEREGRVFAIMYDLTGLGSDLISQVIIADWKHLIRDQALIDSSAYMREDGKAVVVLSGYEYSKFAQHLQVIVDTVKELRSMTPGGVYVILGVPHDWRDKSTSTSPGVYLGPIIENDIDAICPEGLPPRPEQHSLDKYADEDLPADAQYLRDLHDRGGRKVEYLPTLWSGLSARNSTSGYLGLNTIKRDGGRVLWNQIWAAKRAGCRSVLCASWDGYNTGSAVLPVVSSKRMLPEKGQFLALDADGADLPPDWYMRVCGMAAEGFHNERRILETFPIKELQDYWSTRPKYEEPREKEKEAESSAASSSVSEAWKEKTEEPTDEPPPPPYSLESATAAPVTAAPVTTASSSVTAQHNPHAGTVSSDGVVPATAPQTISPTIATTGHDSPAPSQRYQSVGSLTSYPSSSSSLSANLSHSSTPPGLPHTNSYGSQSSSAQGVTSAASYFTHEPHRQTSAPTSSPEVDHLANSFGRQSLSPSEESTIVAHPHEEIKPGLGSGPQVWPPPEWRGNSSPTFTQVGSGFNQHGHPTQHTPWNQASDHKYQQGNNLVQQPSWNQPSDHSGQHGNNPTPNMHQAAPWSQPQRPYGGVTGQHAYSPTGTPTLYTAGSGTPPLSGSPYQSPNPNQPRPHSHTLPQGAGGNYPSSTPPFTPPATGGEGYGPVPPHLSGTPPPQNPHSPYGGPPHNPYPGGPPAQQPHYGSPYPHHAQTLPQGPSGSGYGPNSNDGPFYGGNSTPPAPYAPYGNPVQQHAPYGGGYVPHPMAGQFANSGQSSPGHSPNFIAGTGNFSLGIAANTIDRFAGEDARRRLEQQADGLLKTGTKLFNRFTK